MLSSPRRSSSSTSPSPCIMTFRFVDDETPPTVRPGDSAAVRSSVDEDNNIVGERQQELHTAAQILVALKHSRDTTSTTTSTTPSMAVNMTSSRPQEESVTIRRDDWQAKYDQLREFQKTHGHCLVTSRSADRGLGEWVQKLRQQDRSMQAGRPHRLNAKRLDRLNRIGFVWDNSNKNNGHRHGLVCRGDAQWLASYNDLLRYRRVHGDCSVPSRCPGLGRWVQTQRRHYRELVRRPPDRTTPHSRIDAARIRLLNSVGFVWSCKDAATAAAAATTSTKQQQPQQHRPKKNMLSECFMECCGVVDSSTIQ